MVGGYTDVSWTHKVLRALLPHTDSHTPGDTNYRLTNSAARFFADWPFVYSSSVTATSAEQRVNEQSYGTDNLFPLPDKAIKAAMHGKERAALTCTGKR